MPERQIISEFREQYADTPYPFMDNATLVSQSGVRISKDLFVDASFYPVGNASALYISNIAVEPRLVTITVVNTPFVTVTLKASFDPLFAPELLQFTDEYGRPAGLLVSETDRLTVFSQWASGEYTFRSAATSFVPSVVIPVPGVGVRGFRTPDGDILTGDVIFVGDDGIAVREEEPGVIRVDAVGDPLFRRRLCEPLEIFEVPQYVKTINNMPGDAYGNFQLNVGTELTEDHVMRIRNHKDGIIVDAFGAT